MKTHLGRVCVLESSFAFKPINLKGIFKIVLFMKKKWHMKG
jgi:hypothetical protein